MDGPCTPVTKYRKSAHRRPLSSSPRLVPASDQTRMAPVEAGDTSAAIDFQVCASCFKTRSYPLPIAPRPRLTLRAVHSWSRGEAVGMQRV